VPETITISVPMLLLIIWLFVVKIDPFELAWLLIVGAAYLVVLAFKLLFTTGGLVAALILSYFIFGVSGPKYILMPIGIVIMIALILEPILKDPKKSDGEKQDPSMLAGEDGLKSES